MLEKVKFWMNDYDYSTGSYVEKEREAYDQEEIDKIKNKAEKLKLEESKITTDGKIYFTQDCVFPRHRLKEICNNKVTRNIENAEYVIINKDKFPGTHFLYSRYLYDYGDGKPKNYRPNNLPYNAQYKAVTVYEITDKLERFIKEISGIEGKKIIYDSQLNRSLPRSSKLEASFYLSVKKMLNSKNKENIKLGSELITEVDYSTYSGEIVLLLNENIQEIRKYGCAGTVAFKCLLEMVNKDYPQWESENQLKMVLQLVSKHPGNENIMNFLNEFFNAYWKIPDGRKYKITIE